MNRRGADTLISLATEFGCKTKKIRRSTVGFDEEWEFQIDGWPLWVKVLVCGVEMPLREQFIIGMARIK